MDQRTPRGFFYQKQKSRGFPRLPICIILVVLSRNLFDRLAAIIADIGVIGDDQPAFDTVAREVDVTVEGVGGLVIGAVKCRRTMAVAEHIADCLGIEASGMDKDIGDIFEDLNICGWGDRAFRVAVVFDNHIVLHDVDDDADAIA